MNRTTKAKYDLAERMLNVHIEPAEVAIMSDLPLEEVEKLKANLMKNSDTGGTNRSGLYGRACHRSQITARSS